LANYAGVAPVCFSSAGKGKYVQNKNQGNRELYSVLYLLAMQQVHVNTKGQARNPLLRAYFESKVCKHHLQYDEKQDSISDAGNHNKFDRRKRTGDILIKVW